MKAFAFKLYVSKRNRHLHRQIDVAAAIWNHCIALHRRYYRLYGKHLSSARLQLHITKLKKRPAFAFWNDLGSQAIQDIAQRIDRAYRRFFDSVKARKTGQKVSRVSPPGFKKRLKYRSFTLKQAGYKFLDGNRVRIGSRTYRYFQSRDIDGDAKTLTVKRDPLGDIYICLSVETTLETVNRTATGKMAGADFGLKTFLKLSDGSDVKSPEHLKGSLKAFRKASRELSRKKKGSMNRKKAKFNLARIHRTVKHRRDAFHWETANRLCGEYDVLCLEDLSLKGMQSLWGRKVSDLGFGNFVRVLETQARKHGTRLVFVDRFYPSTKTCSFCREVNGKVTLRDRRWECPVCGTIHDRDLNAAVNLLRVGISTLGLGDVRPAEPAVAV